MSNFVEERFPEDIAYNYTGGAVFSTEVNVAQNGNEQRNINRQNARAEYIVQHDFKNKQQINELIAFFRTKKGQGVGFRFKDWVDYSVTAENIGVGDGVETQFQLIKNYTSGAVTVARNITKPVTDTVNIYTDSVLQNSGYSADYTTGIITFDSAPSGSVVITADFEFDVPVRFADDEMKVEAKSDGTYNWNKVKLVEVLL
jgi:uncharacterized protein (TIGR02217 family)